MAGVNCLHQAMICLAVLLLATHHAQGTEEAESYLLAAASGGGQEQRRKVSWVPVPTVVYQSLTPEEAAASEPFATCGACRCCPTSSDQSSCVQTQCCFGIKCNIPGKPFGTCSFSPNTCGCGPNNCSSSGSPPRLIRAL